MARMSQWDGRFYPGSESELKAMIEGFWSGDREPVKAKAIIVPHAGYVYSGKVAGAVYSSVELPHKFLITCPNHWEGRTSAGLDFDGEWSTLLGTVPVDSDLAERILSGTDLIEGNKSSHAREHAIEVQLPFLQYNLGNRFSFVPVSLLTMNFEDLAGIGSAFAEAVKETDGEILMIASTDMSHYVPHDDAVSLDRKAIDRILALDPQGLYDTVRGEGISMCGLSATVSILIAAVELGAQKAELIRYMTSGEVSGDYEQVVGYAGIVVT